MSNMIERKINYAFDRVTRELDALRSEFKFLKNDMSKDLTRLIEI